MLSAGDAREAQRWDDLVSGAPGRDVYFRPGYTSAYESAGHGQAIALVADAPGGSLLVPLLVRDLPDVPAAWRSRHGLDATTAYGYGGLLPLDDAPSVEQAEAALRGVRRWCVENGVVSVLFRLHPLLEQQNWLSGAIARVEGSALRPVGPTSAVDVALWSESRMRRDRRSNLKTARRTLRVTWSSPSGGEPPIPQALRMFDRIYTATMDRLHASSFYFFPPEYYDALARGLGERLGVAIAWHGDEAVAASLFLCDQAFAHYHLSGSTQRGREHGAPTLLVCAGIEWARARGCRFVHLGGATSGGDALFEFKRGFGGPALEYGLMTLVADPARYASLVAARCAAGGAPPRTDFFPEYRG